jgi:membrane protein DedA with SNARE-associated domain
MPSLDRLEDDDSEAEDGEVEEPPRRPSRRTLSLILTPIAALVIISWIGDASAVYLVDHHPLWLIALNARNRNLVLVVNHLDALPYYTVGTLRLLLSDPLFYLLGYFYGDAAIAWMEKQAPTYGKFMRTAERWFGTATYPLVFFAPNNYICLFAGAAGMPIPTFLALNVTGTIVRLYMIRVVGDIFAGPIDHVIRFIQDYRLPLLALSLLLIAITIWNERRQGKGELTSLVEFEEEMEEEMDVAADDEDAES